jgi:hypothetical protein
MTKLAICLLSSNSHTLNKQNGTWTKSIVVVASVSDLSTIYVGYAFVWVSLSMRIDRIYVREFWSFLMKL